MANENKSVAATTAQTVNPVTPILKPGQSFYQVKSGVPIPEGSASNRSGVTSDAVKSLKATGDYFEFPRLADGNCNNSKRANIRVTAKRLGFKVEFRQIGTGVDSYDIAIRLA